MGFESIISQIQSLPPLPESVLRLEEAFRKGEPDMKTIVSIIERDPLLTADILAKVNAPAYGLKNRVVSVMQAVTLFGLNTVRAFALKAAMERNFEIDMAPYGISNEQFSKMSAMQNALMFQWYMGIDVEKAKIVIPISFLMETGKVVIAKELNESAYGDMFRDALNESLSIDDVEEEFAGTTSAGVTALLFQHWHFEESFIRLMESLARKEGIEPDIAQMALALDAVCTAINVKEQLSEKSIEAGGKVVARMGHDSARFVTTARRIREKYN